VFRSVNKRKKVQRGREEEKQWRKERTEGRLREERWTKKNEGKKGGKNEVRRSRIHTNDGIANKTNT
jgi:hypothetical protein